MWTEIIEYLKDPYLVARIQGFFGVKIHYDTNSEKSEISDCQDQRKNECASIISTLHNDSTLHHRQKKNGFNLHEKDCNLSDINTSVHCENKDDLTKNKNINKDVDQRNFTITNYFWYYLFLFGTELGDEIFYSSFIPFWFWNIDGPVGRRVVLVWAIVMTIGQALKDIICWPRPACPPAVRLQSKWSQEYGMPSTHAMIGISIPFSIVLFTMNRYIYSFPIGCTIALLWCALVSISRLYLGMHTVLDVLVGLLLAICLMIPLIPLVDFMDYYFVTNTSAIVVLIAISILTIIYYPSSETWTPTRGDTTMVVSVTTGVHAGAWLNYKIGVLIPPSLSPPYEIIWPSYGILGHLVLRTMLGFCCVIATKVICKSLCYTAICAILKINSKELMKSENHLENKNKIFVDLVYKYVACFMIGLNTVYLMPNVFAMIGIDRLTFYTEM